MSALPVTPTFEPAPVAGRLRIARAPLSCETVRSFRDLTAVADEWDHLLAELDAPLASTLQWCRTWWEQYGGGREARIYLFRDRNELVGLAPMLIDRVRLGPIVLRIGKMMGSDYLPMPCGLPVRPAWARVAVDEMLEQLMRHERCDALLLAPLSATPAVAGALEELSERRRDLVTVCRERIVGEHSTINLPGSRDAYMRSLSRGQRAEIRRQRRRLARGRDVRVDVITDRADLSTELLAFACQHQRQWASTGQRGLFGLWPNAESFHRAALRGFASDGEMRIHRLQVDGRVIARHLAYARGGTCWCWASARDDDRRWHEYGTGRLCLTGLIEHAIEAGDRRIDLGLGRDKYTARLGAVSQPVRSLLLAARRGGVESRVRHFCSLADALDTAYHDLWFRRIAPRIGAGERPLWGAWIRSRV